MKKTIFKKIANYAESLPWYNIYSIPAKNVPTGIFTLIDLFHQTEI